MDTTKWGCKDNCVYSTKDGVMVCFKAGEMPVTCQDGENELEKDYTEIWTATGEVPNKLAEAPPAPLYFKRLRNQTFEWLAVLPLDQVERAKWCWCHGRG